MIEESAQLIVRVKEKLIGPAREQQPRPALLEDVVLAAAFQQRRKMLRTSLRSVTNRPDALLEEADVPPTARAEQVDVAAFCRLARCHQALRRGANPTATSGTG